MFLFFCCCAFKTKTGALAANGGAEQRERSYYLFCVTAFYEILG